MKDVAIMEFSEEPSLRYPAQTIRRVLVIVTAINLVGMACLWASLQSPMATRADVTGGPDAMYLLESVGFALMLPGIFFASLTLLLARFFGWNEGTTCAVWYISGGLINLLIARTAGDKLLAE
ncbi:MAG: hypothetical protein ABIP75_03940 [Pyrinomonadaceae bacterium]